MSRTALKQQRLHASRLVRLAHRWRRQQNYLLPTLLASQMEQRIEAALQRKGDRAAQEARWLAKLANFGLPTGFGRPQTYETSLSSMAAQVYGEALHSALLNVDYASLEGRLIEYAKQEARATLDMYHNLYGAYDYKMGRVPSKDVGNERTAARELQPLCCGDSSRISEIAHGSMGAKPKRNRGWNSRFYGENY